MGKRWAHDDDDQPTLDQWEIDHRSPDGPDQYPYENPNQLGKEEE